MPKKKNLVLSVLSAVILLITCDPCWSQTTDHQVPILATSIRGKECHHGLQHQPNGPFAVMVFCEDALGTYLAVMCYDPGPCNKSEYSDGTIRFSGWQIDNRVWQENPWTSDVDSFAWSLDGKSLFIGTSDIYGAGGMYQLNLEQRKSKQIMPKKQIVSVDEPGAGYSIVSINRNGSALNYRLIDHDDNDTPVLQLSVGE